MAAKKKIERKAENTILAGVCGAIAERFSFDPKVVRIVYIAFTVLTAFFPGFFLYMFLMLIFPRKVSE